VRIPKNWVPIIAGDILKNLVSKKLVEPLVPQDELLRLTHDIILGELMAEDRVVDEVRELLKSYEGQIEKTGMDYKKLFDLTKHKLIKERNIVT
jgi:hypothetical protein